MTTTVQLSRARRIRTGASWRRRTRRIIEQIRQQPGVDRGRRRQLPAARSRLAQPVRHRRRAAAGAARGCAAGAVSQRQRRLLRGARRARWRRAARFRPSTPSTRRRWSSSTNRSRSAFCRDGSAVGRIFPTIGDRHRPARAQSEARASGAAAGAAAAAARCRRPVTRSSASSRTSATCRSARRSSRRSISRRGSFPFRELFLTVRASDTGTAMAAVRTALQERRAQRADGESADVGRAIRARGRRSRGC